VVFDHAFYSAPHRFIGQKLWVRGADTSVRIFHQHELVATHSRAARWGQRLTNPDHLPPAKVAGLLATPASCVRRADGIGPATSELVGRVLGDRPLDRLRTVLGILKLAQIQSPPPRSGLCPSAAVRRCNLRHAETHAGSRPRSDSLAGGVAHRDTQERAGVCATGHRFLPPDRKWVVPLNHQLGPKLKTLRLSGILATLDVRTQQAITEKLSYVEFLKRLVEDEVERHAQKQLQLRPAARRSISGKRWRASLTPRSIVSRSSTWRPAGLSSGTRPCSFNSPQASANRTWHRRLGHEACRRGFDVVFISAARMLGHLHGGRADGTYERRLLTYTRPDVLILDDFGLSLCRPPVLRISTK
jgi:hypothetical protein